MHALLLAVVLITATVSGVFGMAGGLMLMGALTLAMPVSAAMVTHGAVQFVSNGWRAILHRAHIDWRIILMYGIGSAIAAGLLASVTYEPTKAWVYVSCSASCPASPGCPKANSISTPPSPHTPSPAFRSPASTSSPASLARCSTSSSCAPISPAPRHRRHQSRDAGVQPHRENDLLRRAAHHRRRYRPAALVVFLDRRAARHDRRMARRHGAGSDERRELPQVHTLDRDGAARSIWWRRFVLFATG